MRLRWLEAQLSGAKLRLKHVQESAAFGYAGVAELRDAQIAVSEAERRLLQQAEIERDSAA
jgi:hypothetical protein